MMKMFFSAKAWQDVASQSPGSVDILTCATFESTSAFYWLTSLLILVGRMYTFAW